MSVKTSGAPAHSTHISALPTTLHVGSGKIRVSMLHVRKLSLRVAQGHVAPTVTEPEVHLQCFPLSFRTRAHCHMPPNRKYLKVSTSNRKYLRVSRDGPEWHTYQWHITRGILPWAFMPSDSSLVKWDSSFLGFKSGFRFKSVSNYQVAWFISECHMCSMFPRKSFGRAAFL